MQNSQDIPGYFWCVILMLAGVENSAYTASMNTSQMERFVAAAESQYNDALPYHTWGHAQEVMESLKGLLARMERRGNRFPEAKRNGLIVAAAWHDVRFGGEYAKNGFDSEEAFAAYQAARYLEQQGADSAVIAFVEDAILATRHNTQHRSPAGLALHRADIDNIGGPYAGFLATNTSLFQEAEVFGNPIDLQTHKERTAKFVRFTINEMRNELPLLHEHVGTPSAFDTVAAQNLERYLGEATQ